MELHRGEVANEVCKQMSGFEKVVREKAGGRYHQEKRKENVEYLEDAVDDNRRKLGADKQVDFQAAVIVGTSGF
jgi:hypothetical protein